jgi:proline iminopeptidase
MPPKEGFVTTEDGLRLFFETRGEGSPAALVPNGLYLLRDLEPLAADRLLIAYDPRNRGRSDRSGGAPARGLPDDARDLEAVRRHFGLVRPALIGHSYVGFLVVLFALRYPAHVGRIVQLGPTPPFADRRYPPHLTGADETVRDVFARLAALRGERGPADPEDRCRRVWSILRLLYVTDPADADRIDWGRCDLPNERSFMTYWTETVQPSIRALCLSAEDLARVSVPVLTIHGTRDRSAPYGGGREWALLLPNARLLAVENAGHAPWVEAPARVLGAMEDFLEGRWPRAARQVRSLEP